MSIRLSDREGPFVCAHYTALEPISIILAKLALLSQNSQRKNMLLEGTNFNPKRARLVFEKLGFVFVATLNNKAKHTLHVCGLFLNASSNTKTKTVFQKLVLRQKDMAIGI